MVMKALGFKGEMLFTSTLMNLIDQRPSVVYFTQGMGYDLNSEALDGYLSQAVSGGTKSAGSIPLAAPGRNHRTMPPWSSPEETSPGVAKTRSAGLPRTRRTRAGCLSFQILRNATGLEDWLRSWSLQVGQNVIDDVTKFSGSNCGGNWPPIMNHYSAQRPRWSCPFRVSHPHESTAGGL